MNEQKPMGMGLIYAHVAERMAREQRDEFVRKLLWAMFTVAVMQESYNLIRSLL